MYFFQIERKGRALKEVAHALRPIGSPGDKWSIVSCLRNSMMEKGDIDLVLSYAEEASYPTTGYSTLRR